MSRSSGHPSGSERADEARGRLMDCNDCLERLYPYLDRELEPREFDEVRVHLDECGGCDAAFVVERVFLERVRGSATADVAPPGVRERLIVRLRGDLRRRS